MTSCPAVMCNTGAFCNLNLTNLLLLKQGCSGSWNESVHSQPEAAVLKVPANPSH